MNIVEKHKLIIDITKEATEFQQRTRVGHLDYNYREKQWELDPELRALVVRACEKIYPALRHFKCKVELDYTLAVSFRVPLEVDDETA